MKMLPLIVLLLLMSAVSAVQPQVNVSGQEKGDGLILICHINGFHPGAVDVKWMKNKKDEVHSYETTHVLNPDGTYQIRVSTEVTPKDGDTVSCYVDHSSLKEPLNIEWASDTSSDPNNPASA